MGKKLGGEWGQRMARIKKPKKKKPKDFQILGQNNSLPERSGQKGQSEKRASTKGRPELEGQKRAARNGKVKQKNIISDISTLASQS
jgi:hypothetical protein